METRQYQVYKFAELSQEVKDKVLENYRYINVDYNWYDCYDGLLDLTADEMKAINVRLSKKWYQSKKTKDDNGNIIGEYPAYTGLIKYKIIAFDLNRENYIQFDDIQIMNDDIFRKFLKIPKSLWNKIDYSFHNSIGYNTEIIFDNTDYLTEAENNLLVNATEIFSGKVNEASSMLSKTYYDLLTDDSVIDTIEANDYDFNLNGKID